MHTLYTGFVRVIEYLEKYGIQLSIFQGHEKYEIQSCGMESIDFQEFCGDFYEMCCPFVCQYIYHAI